jgi:FixJ family two-component response regulator
MPTTDSNSIIYVVDDDPSIRDSVRSLLKSVGLHAVTFESPDEFMSAARPEIPSCLLLDVALPAANGLEFQAELAKVGIHIPIVFITAHGDIPMTSRAIKAGAVEFLTKPFQKNDLLTAIHQALDRDRAQRKEQSDSASLRERHQTLTSREREVMALVVTGLMNKEVAAKLGLSEVTIKIHRGHVMQKMKAKSLAELVRMADRLKPRSAR